MSQAMWQVMSKALIVTGLFLCIVSAAYAQPDKRFERADANHDGRVTLQEYQTFVGNRLRKAKGPRAEKFRSLDPEQQAAVLQKRFQKLDREHKGYLSPEDFESRRHG